jgi:transposase
MSFILPTKSSDEEKRYLRIKNDRLHRAIVSHKKTITELEAELRELRRKTNEQQEEIERLKQEREKVRKERDMYRKMLFKKNKEKKELPSNNDLSPLLYTSSKRGGKKGHKGKSRFLPSSAPDQIQRVFFTHCPDCHTLLQRTESIDVHTVEDLPSPQTTPVVVTRYEKERQWCNHCHKEIVATAPSEIPGSRFGIQLLVYVLLLKYGCKMSFDAITLLLFHTYTVTISTGALIQILYRAKKYLGWKYDLIRDAVRASPVKHADETGWRVDGINSWVWAFLTKKEVYLIIEESRGGGIPKRELEGAHADDVLVRDDYKGYQKLPLKHQSCWAHLLRKTHEAVEEKGASQEMRELHSILTDLFVLLKQSLSIPVAQRKRIYHQAWNILSEIISTSYTQEDAQQIQTRIRNQGKNLLTALLYQDVPLTNNLAERSLRPLVVQRKISGGSRSWKGAKTTAINTSVYQTIQLQNLPLLDTLQEYLLAGATGKP